MSLIGSAFKYGYGKYMDVFRFGVNASSRKIASFFPKTENSYGIKLGAANSKTNGGSYDRIREQFSPEDLSNPGRFFDALLFRGARKTTPGPSAAEAARRANESPRNTADRLFGTRFQDNISRSGNQAKGFVDSLDTHLASKVGLASNKKSVTHLNHAMGVVKSRLKKVTRSRIPSEEHTLAGARKRLEAKHLTARYDELKAQRNSLKSDNNAASVSGRGGQRIDPNARNAYRASKDRARSSEATAQTAFSDAIKYHDSYSSVGRPMAGIPNWLVNHPKTVVGAMALGSGLGTIDSVAGYAIGGTGYGGAIGFGEGATSSRQNIFQGANVNMNFQAQTMAHEELAASSVLSQMRMGTAPMMSRSMGRQFQNSAQGLTLGLHKGRHGGY
jgi:hypothetical protein